MRLESSPHPGVRRYALGRMRVTILFDGDMDAHPAALSGVPPEEIAAMMRFGEPGAPPPRSSVNVWVIETAPGAPGNRAILVDGGALPGMAERAGHTLARMADAGFSPETIDTVFCTHLHPDHIGMLTTGDAATLPKARLALHEAEPGHWMDDARFAAAPDRAKPFFLAARKVLAAYAGRTDALADADEIAPGIALAHLPGHTPGHCGLKLESDGETLLIFADIVHIDSVQFARPEASIMFDVDKAAADTRRRIFATLAEEGVPAAGAHVAYPGVGHVRRSGAGYRFEPLS